VAAFDPDGGWFTLPLEDAAPAVEGDQIEAPDGRVSESPRALCAVATADGRGGVDWVEWNRNRSLT
jgi:hypothetical protein